MAEVVSCPSFRTIVVDPAVQFLPAYPDPATDFEFAAPPAGLAPGYPVFGRAEETSSESDSEAETPPPPPPAARASECALSPRASPESMRKSRSTGGIPAASSPAGGCRMKDLVVGRSKSEGRGLFGSSARKSPVTGGRKEEKDAAAAAYGRLYGRGGEEERRRRRSFAESYRKELVGFLPSLKGLRRTFLNF